MRGSFLGQCTCPGHTTEWVAQSGWVNCGSVKLVRYTRTDTCAQEPLWAAAGTFGSVSWLLGAEGSWDVCPCSIEWQRKARLPLEEHTAGGQSQTGAGLLIVSVEVLFKGENV